MIDVIFAAFKFDAEDIVVEYEELQHPHYGLRSYLRSCDRTREHVSVK